MATITKTVKTVNYTPEQTAMVIDQYTGGVTVEAIAIMVGKSVRSVVAKLSRELKGTDNAYKAKVHISKTGEAVVKKDELADKIGALLGATEAEMESLTKVNKTMLKKILEALPSVEDLVDIGE